MKKLILLGLIISQSVFANYLDDHLKKLDWNGVEVVWLDDDTYPTYNLSVYFHAGAISDEKGKYGETEFMFNELTSGTTRYSKKEIVDALEFYGTSYGASVTHEYSTFTVSGLIKDIVPSMKMVCHAFKHATYPEAEFAKTKKRAVFALKSMVNNHGSLASHVFREVSLSETPYGTPVSGNIKSIQGLTARGLHTKLKYFTEKVKKKIYIRGPKQIKNLENIIAKDCGWSGEANTVEKLQIVDKAPSDNNTIYFVPVPNANQAQVRIGRYMTSAESHANYTGNEFASRYLGGGFTSRLMKELRVDRGLTYTAGAYASAQKMYGRAGINTFTKNTTIVELLKVIKEVIKKESTDIQQENYEHSKRYLKGNYLFSLESSSGFLANLQFFDHIGRDYSEIYKFSSELDLISKDQLQKDLASLFAWDKQTKLVLGDRSLIRELENAGFKVRVLDYNKYL